MSDGVSKYIGNIEWYSEGGWEYKFMTLSWDLSRIEHSDLVCWEYSDPADNLTLDDGWEPTTDGMVVRMNPKTTGLIMASEKIHLNNISSSNILEWIYRLDSFFDAGESYLATFTEEGEVPIPLTLHDVKDHVGLRTSATNWTKTRLDSRVRELRITRHLRDLNRF